MIGVRFDIRSMLLSPDVRQVGTVPVFPLIYQGSARLWCLAGPSARSRGAALHRSYSTMFVMPVQPYALQPAVKSGTPPESTARCRGVVLHRSRTSVGGYRTKSRIPLHCMWQSIDDICRFPLDLLGQYALTQRGMNGTDRGADGGAALPAADRDERQRSIPSAANRAAR